MSDRIVACEHADRCGGCPAIELSYDEQLALKRGRLVGALARYGSLELVYADPVLGAEPVTEYRTRAKLMVGPRGAIGLFAKGGGHDVVDVPGCRVLSPVVARVVAAVRLRVQHDAKNGGPLAPGPLRAIDVRELRAGDPPRVLLTLVVGRGYDLEALRAVGASLLAEIPEVIGVAASLHDGDTPQVLGSETHVLAGASEADDRVGECVHVATFGSFVQAHRAQAARIHDLVATQLGLGRTQGEPTRVLDLYAGSGAIAFALASRGARVTCVEAFGPAAGRIEKGADARQLPVRALHSDVASALRALHEKGERFDAVVANPPRRGIGPAAREWLARLAPPAVAYVSCDPDTLARDLDHLARLGYRCASAQPLDMIPLSDEVETVALLRRTPPPAARVLFEDDTAIFVDKAPHEPMTPKGDYAESLLARVRRLPNAEDAVPVTALGVGTSGVALFARTPAHLEAWQRALDAGSRKIHLVATRGVLPTKGSITRDVSPASRREPRSDAHPGRTKYRRLAVFAGHGVARVMTEPDGGKNDRTHQIRRHLASIGHPVLGDDRFGHAATNRHFEEKYGLDRTFLHCVRFEVDHPVSGTHLVIESPLPGDLQTVLERAGGPGTLRFLEQKNALGRGNSSIPPPPSVRTSGVISLRESGSEGRILRADIVGDDDEPPSS